MTFQIIVFEYQSLYDGTSEIQDEKEAVKKFLDYCEEYLQYSKEYPHLSIGELYVSYADNSGRDKPLNILLIGKLTQESKDHIKTELVVSSSPHVCSICQDSISSEGCQFICCGHTYHTNCIRTWFSTSVRCPVCCTKIREDQDVLLIGKLTQESKDHIKTELS